MKRFRIYFVANDNKFLFESAHSYYGFKGGERGLSLRQAYNAVRRMIREDALFHIELYRVE